VTSGVKGTVSLYKAKNINPPYLCTCFGNFPCMQAVYA